MSSHGIPNFASFLKIFNSCSFVCLQGHKEWVTEVNVLGVVEHPNLVKLIGYCAEDDERGIQRLLIYEYMPNRSVQDHLTSRFQATLPWNTRLKIAQDAARGLAYLHEGMDFQVLSYQIVASWYSSMSVASYEWDNFVNHFGWWGEKNYLLQGSFFQTSSKFIWNNQNSSRRFRGLYVLNFKRLKFKSGILCWLKWVVSWLWGITFIIQGLTLLTWSKVRSCLPEDPHGLFMESILWLLLILEIWN